MFDKMFKCMFTQMFSMKLIVPVLISIQTMHDFITNTQERDAIKALGKKKKVKKKITILKKKEINKEEKKKTDSSTSDAKPDTSEEGGEEEEEEVVEVEVEETEEEMEERCIRENSERIAKELADARHEVRPQTIYHKSILYIQRYVMLVLWIPN